MAALDRERKTQKLSDHTVVDLLFLPAKAGAKGFLGAIAVLNAGFLTPATTATGLIAVGVFEYTVDNTTGKDGDIWARIRQGTFPFFNSGGPHAIAQTDAGKDFFLFAHQTVAKTGGGAGPPPAGKIHVVAAECFILL